MESNETPATPPPAAGADVTPPPAPHQAPAAEPSAPPVSAPVEPPVEAAQQPPAHQPPAPAPTPKKSKNLRNRDDNVTTAIIATAFIVIVLASLAVIAFLKQN